MLPVPCQRDGLPVLEADLVVCEGRVAVAAGADGLARYKDVAVMLQREPVRELGLGGAEGLGCAGEDD